VTGYGMRQIATSLSVAAALWLGAPAAEASTTLSAQLLGIACTSSSNCTAVGDEAGAVYVYTLVEHWSGSEWSVVSSPSPANSEILSLSGVACIGASSCMAVGYSGSYSKVHALVEHWNGIHWSIVPSPSPSSSTDLSAIACTKTSSCTAVGYYDNTAGGFETLVEHWNGSKWSVVTSPNPSGPADMDDLHAVACTAASSCTAAGNSITSANPTLVEHWNGSKWAIVPSPSNGDIHSELDGIACTSASSCTAVGYYYSDIGTYTLVEHWNGEAWSIVSSPNSPPGLLGASNSLNGVSCFRASNCMAVGAGSRGPLVEHWNGSGWSVMMSPTGGVKLESVTCPGATTYTAVGLGVSPGALSFTIVEHWNGKLWSIVKSPN
jgi:hypothetical protein